MRPSHLPFLGKLGFQLGRGSVNTPKIGERGEGAWFWAKIFHEQANCVSIQLTRHHNPLPSSLALIQLATARSGNLQCQIHPHRPEIETPYGHAIAYTARPPRVQATHMSKQHKAWAPSIFAPWISIVHFVIGPTACHMCCAIFWFGVARCSYFLSRKLGLNAVLMATSMPAGRGVGPETILGWWVHQHSPPLEKLSACGFMAVLLETSAATLGPDPENLLQYQVVAFHWPHSDVHNSAS